VAGTNPTRRFEKAGHGQEYGRDIRTWRLGSDDTRSLAAATSITGTALPTPSLSGHTKCALYHKFPGTAVSSRVRHTLGPLSRSSTLGIRGSMSLDTGVGTPAVHDCDVVNRRVVIRGFWRHRRHVGLLNGSVGFASANISRQNSTLGGLRVDRRLIRRLRGWRGGQAGESEESGQGPACLSIKPLLQHRAVCV
jgi:hypothetical protein